MKPQATLVEIFKGVYGFCEKNSLEFPPTNGRPPILSFAQLLTLKISWELSRVKDFKTFYHGPMRKILEDFFPKLPEYSGIMKRLPKIWDILANAFKNKKHHGKFIIDSTPMKLCLQVRFKRFKTMQEAMGLAVSSTKRVCGFKVHVVTDMRGKKVVNFCFSNGASHAPKKNRKVQRTYTKELYKKRHRIENFFLQP
jgi:hypothetical protein